MPIELEDVEEYPELVGKKVRRAVYGLDQTWPIVEIEFTDGTFLRVTECGQAGSIAVDVYPGGNP